MLAVVLPLAAAPYAAWLALRPSGAQQTYLSILLGELRVATVAEIAARAATSSLVNLNHLLGVLVPGGVWGVPSYSLTTRFPSTLPSGSQEIAIGVGCILLMLGGLGLLLRRREAGGLTSLYLMIYLLVLSLWPSRDERFLWPLLAPLLIFVPTGYRSAMRRLQSHSVLIASLAYRGSFVIVSALLLWQVFVCAGMALTSLMWHRNADAPENASLSAYYADWDQAGGWLRKHSLPFDRVITSRTSLFITSRRFQQSMLFGPADINGKIHDLRRSYLAIPNGPFGSQVTSLERLGDWMYQLVPVYRRRRRDRSRDPPQPKRDD